MTSRARKPGFAARPGDAERWIKAPEAPSHRASASVDRFTARLTIDVTPAMRRGLKLAALKQGETVADMLRALFAREFPNTTGDE